MHRGLFITGTDTHVGKTVVSAALMHRYRERVPLKYWKPIQTGIEQDDDTATVRSLGNCTDEEIFDAGIRFLHPVSPHRAAQLAGMEINLDNLCQLITRQSADCRWIVEGAGGALVPINDSQLMADLMACLKWPIVVVGRSSLGTINHTLLTLEALRQRSLAVCGVVMVGESNPENRAAIEHYGQVAVLGDMPHWNLLTSETLRQWGCAKLDPGGVLWECLK